MVGKGNHIALIGNPNCGKSTVFNRLTGLRQSTSNLPGTTVEEKNGTWKLEGNSIKLTDLPGIYSLFTRSDEEGVVVDHLLGNKVTQPDLLIFLLDASNLRRNLLLFSQVKETGIPMIVALTMMDTAQRKGLKVNENALSEAIGVPVFGVNGRTGEGLDALSKAVNNGDSKGFAPNPTEIEKLKTFRSGADIRGLSEQTLLRYKEIESIVAACVSKSPDKRISLTRKLDGIFTHKILGYAAFAFIMLTIFQGVFTLAEYPMTWIEKGFAYLSSSLSASLGDGFWGKLVTGGLLPGLSGVLVFLPQIAILFFFVSLLEDSGYMVRASFITDKIMRRIGLNGRSVIPLIGGFACAIPSIMATRSIKNKGERLATMFVIPLMSCSARLPVYVLLVSLAVPKGSHFGPIGLQSLVMTLAYFSGILLAVLISLLIKVYRKDREISEFILELPPYQLPRLQTVWTTVFHKSKSFVTEAGKIIIAISLILWFLSSFGPGQSMEMEAQAAKQKAILAHKSPQETAVMVSSAELKASYAGIMGRVIEPAIAPLGYDWKTGIALVSSFAAREVFVGTMSTLFNSEDADNLDGIRAKMMKAKNPETGKPLYGAAYALSLIMFYAFALQCMSTLAVMKRETGSWKLPLLQFFGYGAIAWVSAFVVYRLTILL